MENPIAQNTDAQELSGFDNERLELIRRTLLKGATDDEFSLFIDVCRRTGLDPVARQLYAVRRWDSRERREVMQTQISIDGAKELVQARRALANEQMWLDTFKDAGPASSRMQRPPRRNPDTPIEMRVTERYTQRMPRLDRETGQMTEETVMFTVPTTGVTVSVTW